MTLSQASAVMTLFAITSAAIGSWIGSMIALWNKDGK